MKDHLHLHFIVFLWGFTAILGKLISLAAPELVFYRMLLAAITIGLFTVFAKVSLKVPKKDVLGMLGVGVIVALHWITFFGAVKVSNVSVTLGCMASATLFTSFLEPLIERRKILKTEVLLGLLIMIGLYIITQFALDYYLGIIYALISAFLAALFGVLNRQYVQRYEASVISFYEMVAGFSIIALFVSTTTGFSQAPWQLPTLDILWIFILAVICTAYAFVASAELLRRLTAYTVTLAINMEPVYGIILAYFIFGESERMNIGFYIGAVVIILAIFIYPFLRKLEVKDEVS